MKSNRKFEASQRCTVMWINSLAGIAVGFNMSLVFLLVFASPSLAWLMASLLIRGTIVVYWIVGVLLILMGVFYSGAKTEITRKSLATAMVVTAVLLLVMAVISGVDLTKILTSPARILGKIGGAFAEMIGGSKAMPENMRAGGGKAVLRTIGDIATNIAVVQLIGILPTPYNIILFFLYYKTVTAIIICIVPVLLSLWALTMAWSLRKELMQQLEDEDRVPLMDDDRASDVEAGHNNHRHLATSNTTQVHVNPQTQGVVPHYLIHSHEMTPDLHRSDTEVIQTMIHNPDGRHQNKNLYPRLNGHD